MADTDHDKFVEELLEASLKRYRSDEPRAGLETRILASVGTRDAAAQPRRWVLAWALAASAAVLIVAIVVLRFTSHLAPRTVKVSPAVPAVAPKPETPKLVAVTPPRVRVPGKPSQRPRTTTARLRRPEQFPTPTPLTEQEKLLLQYVETTSASDLATQVNQSEPSKDLSIPGIAITALAPIKPVFESDEGATD